MSFSKLQEGINLCNRVLREHNIDRKYSFQHAKEFTKILVHTSEGSTTLCIDSNINCWSHIAFDFAHTLAVEQS